jgi:hypothetical protein
MEVCGIAIVGASQLNSDSNLTEELIDAALCI